MIPAVSRPETDSMEKARNTGELSYIRKIGDFRVPVFFIQLFPVPAGRMMFRQPERSQNDRQQNDPVSLL